MAKLKKIILFFLLMTFILLILYANRGVHISIISNCDSKIRNMHLITDQSIYIGNLDKNNSISMRIRPKHETTIRLKYNIEKIGCFRANVDTYIENGYVGKSLITIKENGDIYYKEKIYNAFFGNLLYTRNWKLSLIHPKRIACEP